MSYKSNQSNTTYKSHKTYMTYAVLFVLLCSFFVTPQKTVHAGVLSRPPVSLGLIDYWSLDEGTGTTARDTASGNKDLTLGAGITWTQGKISKGLSSLTNTAAGSGTSQITNFPFTLSVWSRSTGNNGSGRAALGLVKSGTEYFVVGFSSTNGTPFMAGRNTSFTDAASTAKGLNAWVYLTAVFTSATQRDLYVNGQLANSDTRSVPFVSGSVVNYLMYPMGGNALLDVDEARVYNRALTASEVDRLYKTSGQSVRKGVSNSGLISYWPMNEGRGTVVGDSSGQLNTGTLSGATWVNGKRGGALSFSGSSSNMLSTNLYPTATSVSSVTLSAWIKTSTASGKKIVGFESNQSGTASVSYDRHLYVNTNGKVVMGVYDSAVRLAVSTTSVNTNQWVFVTGTFDLTTKALKIYINGVLENQITTPGAPQNYNGYLRIGSYKLTAWTLGSDGYFPGSIDDVRVYNRALTAVEVQNLYTQSSAVMGTSYENRLTNGLVGFWTMDGKDISGATVADKSGQGNNGTISGATPAIGKVGQGLKFDGVDDLVDTGSATSLDNLGPLTFSLWTNHKGYGESGLGYMLSKNGDFASGFVFGNRVTNSNVEFGVSYSTTDLFVQAVDVLTSSHFNTWNHWVVTWDGTTESDNVHIYKNGVDVTTNRTDGVGSRQSDASNNLLIGNNAGMSRTFDGKLDEVRVYNRALSADEVKQLYRMGQ